MLRVSFIPPATEGAGPPRTDLRVHLQLFLQDFAVRLFATICFSHPAKKMICANDLQV